MALAVVPLFLTYACVRATTQETYICYFFSLPSFLAEAVTWIFPYPTQLLIEGSVIGVSVVGGVVWFIAGSLIGTLLGRSRVKKARMQQRIT